MQILFEQSFSDSLFKILKYIAKDKKTAALNFKKDLKQKIELLKNSPYMCNQSIYFDEHDYRDLTFKGYTIIYKVENKFIKVLDIFKWQTFN